jgi:hypothetical protein
LPGVREAPTTATLLGSKKNWRSPELLLGLVPTILYPPITFGSLGEEFFIKIPHNGLICKTEVVAQLPGLAKYIP